MSQPDPYRRTRSSIRGWAVVALLLSHAAVGLTVWGLMKPKPPPDVELVDSDGCSWVYRVNRYPPFGPNGIGYELELRTREYQADGPVPERPLSRAESQQTRLARNGWLVERLPMGETTYSIQLLDAARFDDGKQQVPSGFYVLPVMNFGGRLTYDPVRLPWREWNCVMWYRHDEWMGNELALFSIKNHDGDRVWYHTVVLVVTLRY